MADSYLVKGAKIKCLCGSQSGELNVENRNISLLKIPIATEDDCVPGINIPSFGICSKTGEPCIPQIPGKWLCTHDNTKINGASAITTDSGLVCGCGGIILSETSGQEAIGKIVKILTEAFKDLLGLGCSPFSGDPVNLCTGNYVLQDTDIQIRGAYPLFFMRTYNSLSKEDGNCGFGWSHNHQIFLETINNSVAIHTGNGGAVRTFSKTKEGYKTDELIKERLLKGLNGYEYIDLANTKYYFNSDGLCTEIQYKENNRITYTYKDNQLIQVQNPCGSMSFSYDGCNKLKQVSDHTGRSAELEYDNGQLVKVSNLLGGWKEYTYDNKGRLIEEIAPNGVKKVINSFDEGDRTIKQEFPDGSIMEYEYDDDAGKVTFTQQNGNKIRFYRDKWQRDCRIVCTDGNVEKKYNDKHQLEECTDRNGNKTIYGHDSIGNITSVINAVGDRTEIEYDRKNNPVKIMNPDKSLIKTEYNLSGRVVKTTDQIGRSYGYRYHETGMIETMIHPDGSEMNLQFDGKGNIIQIVNPFGSKVRYEYDSLNRVQSVIDGNGNRTQFCYDENNNIIKMTDALGYSKEYRYNTVGKVIEIVDPDGRSTKWEYDKMNHPVRRTDRLGREIYRNYDQMWNVAEEIKPNGAVTKYEYDKSNRLEKEISPEGGETKYEYDGNGNCIKRTNPDNTIIKYHYDALNRLIQTDYPNQTSSFLEYNYAGKVIKVLDPNGGEYRMEYDAAGQKIRQINPAGKDTCFEYNALGLQTKIMEPSGRTTQYEYYLGGRLKRVIFPDGSFLEYEYDNHANVISKKDHTGYQVTFTYDALNQVVAMQSNQGQYKGYAYDSMGNIISVINAKGIKSSYEYTATGKLQAVIEPSGLKTCYCYDEVDRLLSVGQVSFDMEENELAEVQQLNRQKEQLLVRYQRNMEGHVISSQNGLGEQITYQRDYFGRVLSETDPEGKETHYAYDTMGNVQKILYPDGKTVLMEYDALNQLVQLKDWLGETSIERSVAGKPVEITDYKGNTMSYEWDLYGKRTKTVYPNGKEIFYQYNQEQKLERIKWDNDFIEYQYDKEGYLAQKTYSNKAESKYDYHSSGQLRYLLHSYKWGWLKSDYEYDAQGLPVTMRESADSGTGNYHYRYDDAGRIVEVLNGLQPVRNYQYDSFGNRVSMTEGKGITSYQYNRINQLVKEVRPDNQIYSYEYDKRGNIRSLSEDGELKESYYYNSQNLLERVNQSDGIEIAYQYDGFGHRIAKKVSRSDDFFKRDADITEFMVDYTRANHNVIGEHSDSGGSVYIREPQSHHLAGMIENGRNFFYQNDHHGSPLRLLDKDGTAIGCCSYDEFGVTERRGKNQGFGFTGYYLEKETGLYHSEKRYYNPVIGLFYGTDIIKGNTAEPFTMHPYMYCWNNPLIFIDLDGASPEYTIEGGKEAHIFLQLHFMAYFGAVNLAYPGSYEADVEVKIPGASSEGNGNVGYADMVLTHHGIAEIYEIKPISHHNPSTHNSLDKDQLDRYVDKHTEFIHPNTFHGYTYDPNELLIPSVLHPDYYIRYYTFYKEQYEITLKGINGRSVSMKGQYEGFIYYGYVKKDNYNARDHWIWIPNQDGQSGQDGQNKDNTIGFPDNVNQDDVAAAATAGAGLVVLYYIAKLIIGGTTQQWWVFCF